MNEDVDLIGSIVDTWLDRAEARPTILYAVNRAHAKQLQDQFVSRGVTAEYMDAFTPIEDRESIRKRFHAGDVSIVCNVGVLIAGIDWDVRCVILACPTKSEIKFVQMIGRGLRTAEGKSDCLVLDHSDTHSRLGFVTDIHHTTLDSGEPKNASEKKVPLPKPCPSCTFMMPPKTQICPACGFKKVSQPGVVEGTGDLVELTPKKAKKFTPEEKQRIWSELLWIAEEKGYSKGWVYHTVMDRCGSAPRFQPTQSIEPSVETRNYVRYKQIRFLKGKNKLTSTSYGR